MKIESMSEQTQSLLRQYKKDYFPIYSPRDMVLDHGKGVRIWDMDGNEYIDLGAGIAVNNLGYSDPDVIDALVTQAKKLLHTSNVYVSEPTIQFAHELVEASFADRVYFSNSGTEANEAAIKLARKHASLKHSTDKREIITFRSSFHGRTLAAVTASAQSKLHQGFDPLPMGFTYSDFNDFEAIERLISNRTCAILIEPLQGEGGIRTVKPGFLQHLRNLCDRYDALLMFDEIQCGFSRTGKLFTYEWDGVTPDVMTVAKPIASGLPLGALLATEKAAQAFQVGDHGSTFGGNPVTTAVGRVVLQKLRRPELLQNVVDRGEQLKKMLAEFNQRHELFSDIRGQGLMIGAELSSKATGQAREIMEHCRLEGVLVLQAGINVLRFLPPLTITESELTEGMQRVEKGLNRFLKSMGS